MVKDIIKVKPNTKIQFEGIQKELAKKNPDLRVSQDYALRILINKFEGDLQ
jgi:hypothetical protein